MGTFIVGAVVLAVVAAIITKIIRDRAAGRPPACSGCSGCANGVCRGAQTKKP